MPKYIKSRALLFLSVTSLILDEHSDAYSPEYLTRWLPELESVHAHWIQNKPDVPEVADDDSASIDDGGSDDGSGSMAVDGYGSMSENEDNEDIQSGIPEQSHAIGDVDPKPATPRGTQRHPATNRARCTQKRQPETEPEEARGSQRWR